MRSSGRLNWIAGAHVCYACPILDSVEALYDEIDLDRIRLVPLATAPGGYLTNQRHHIAFRTPTDPAPMWLSDPAKLVTDVSASPASAASGFGNRGACPENQRVAGVEVRVTPGPGVAASAFDQTSGLIA